jgi:hypothetical protein
MKLTTNLYPVPRLRMHGIIPPLPNTSAWRGAYLSFRRGRDTPAVRNLLIKVTSQGGQHFWYNIAGSQQFWYNTAGSQQF